VDRRRRARGHPRRLQRHRRRHDLGALVACGLDPEWLRALPATLGLDGVTVDVRQVMRAGIACVKVDFDIPPQPHGRHLHEIRRLVAASGAVPELVRERADRAFT
jgi:uncharacterized protein (DUF111 family)